MQITNDDKSRAEKQKVQLWMKQTHTRQTDSNRDMDLPAVDVVGCRVEQSTFHWIGVVCVLSCQDHPLLRELTLKHFPLLGRTQQQHKVRCGHTQQHNTAFINTNLVIMEHINQAVMKLQSAPFSKSDLN